MERLFFNPIGKENPLPQVYSIQQGFYFNTADGNLEHNITSSLSVISHKHVCYSLTGHLEEREKFEPWFLTEVGYQGRREVLRGSASFKWSSKKSTGVGIVRLQVDPGFCRLLGYTGKATSFSVSISWNLKEGLFDSKTYSSLHQCCQNCT